MRTFTIKATLDQLRELGIRVDIAKDILTTPQTLIYHDEDTIRILVKGVPISIPMSLVEVK